MSDYKLRVGGGGRCALRFPDIQVLIRRRILHRGAVGHVPGKYLGIDLVPSDEVVRLLAARTR